MPFIIMSEKIGAPAGSSRSRARQYRRLAVVETDPAFDAIPSRIDYRAAGVVRIVEQWNDLYVGRSPSCGFYKAMDAAEAMVKLLIVERAIQLKRQRLATEGQRQQKVAP